eukprot:TRINITY_DN655_c0_g1_i1.p2 TRINITY_DN655_c0_g1~~TRINITY_DN655_c0_g1_i1.p2  ORF type:complete len:250 (-),score=-20.77 TRINITY_DN655_c0_g1_i1:99-848(-)
MLLVTNFLPFKWSKIIMIQINKKNNIKKHIDTIHSLKINVDIFVGSQTRVQKQFKRSMSPCENMDIQQYGNCYQMQMKHNTSLILNHFTQNAKSKLRSFQSLVLLTMISTLMTTSRITQRFFHQLVVILISSCCLPDTCVCINTLTIRVQHQYVIKIYHEYIRYGTGDYYIDIGIVKIFDNHQGISFRLKNRHYIQPQQSLLYRNRLEKILFLVDTVSYCTVSAVATPTNQSQGFRMLNYYYRQKKPIN